ncbi:MAG: SRPBCC family protein [Bacteroidota bacterium]
MPIIQEVLWIDAPKDRVFDLARSIDLHQVSTAQTNERAVGGRTAGLIELGETVTWRAKHLGVYQHLTVRITEMERPHFFVDEMVKGAFKGFRHQHLFEEEKGGTKMTDIFDYQSPLGWLGYLADWLFLEAYMRRFLAQRNQVIKAFCEGDAWREVLHSK